MCSDGANNDDDEKQSCYDTRDAIQYNHGHGGRRRFPKDVTVGCARPIHRGLIHAQIGRGILRSPTLQPVDDRQGRPGIEHCVQGDIGEARSWLKCTEGSVGTV